VDAAPGAYDLLWPAGQLPLEARVADAAAPTAAPAPVAATPQDDELAAYAAHLLASPAAPGRSAPFLLAAADEPDGGGGGCAEAVEARTRHPKNGAPRAGWRGGG
jgi:hypothetical protein